jgi:TRAP-type uncharacterized transport system substrate-binding protein
VTLRLLVVVLLATLLGVTADGASAQRALTWTSGVVGGGWYALSTGLAELLHDKAALAVKVLPGGGAQNPVLVGKGYVEIGLGLPPLLGAALRGDDPYRGRRLENLRGLAGNMSLNVLHIYVATDSSFARMTLDEIFRERKPIRLAIPRPGTSDVWILERTMEFFGLCAHGRTMDCYRSWELAGARFVRGSYVELAHAFDQRKVDGAFIVLAPPADVVISASQRRPLTLLSCPEPLLEHLASFGLGRGVIPAGTYPKADNAGETITSATMGTTIIVSASMADDLAYAITKTLNDNADRVRRLHASLADYDPSRAWLDLGVTLHPGAERYYREKGWLK